MSNVIEFPKSGRIKEKERKDAFEFHRDRIEKLFYELQYEFMRAYENPELEDEEFHYQKVLNSCKDGKYRKLKFHIFKSDNIF